MIRRAKRLERSFAQGIRLVRPLGCGVASPFGHRFTPSVAIKGRMVWYLTPAYGLLAVAQFHTVHHSQVSWMPESHGSN